MAIGLDAPLQVANWRPLVQWVLAVPHLLLAEALDAVAGVCTLIAAFTVLFTKDIPDALYNMIVMCRRYQWRAYSYAGFLREAYPPFAFDATAADPGGDPATLSITKPATFNRWAPLYKWFLAIPHFVVLVVLGVAVLACVVAAFFAVLFTGRWPEGLRRFVLGYARWTLRVYAYAGMLRDEYPPFSLA